MSSIAASRNILLCTIEHKGFLEHRQNVINTYGAGHGQYEHNYNGVGKYLTPIATTMATTTTMTTTTTTTVEINTTSTTASPPPLIVMITGNGGVFTVGVSHSLTCTASGGASMTYTYQWLRYGRDIVGETSSTISFSPLMLDDTIAKCQIVP